MKKPLLHLLRFFAAIALLAALLLVFVMQPFAGRQTHGKPPVPVNPVALNTHVKTLSVDFHPRSHAHTANLAAAANYIEAQFIAAGAKPVRQAVKAGGQQYYNLLVRFGPKASATAPVIVVGAHYDSDCSDGACTPGADDNASGVAGLLELSRLLVKAPPKHPVELVAYTLEEMPYFRSEFMGSAVHAQSLADAGIAVKLMISMEMIGYFKDHIPSQGYPIPGMDWLYPKAGNFIGVVSQFKDFGNTRRIKSLMSGAIALPVESINAPTWVTGIDWSDHIAYWNLKMPAVMVTDTSFMRNRQYHLTGDTHDKLDYPRMAQVVEGVYAVVQHF
jgi:Zn-dependent M28 family amino/carboxypeptidase